jgi:saccharopine dehydrogenase (NADP+, L-glutamate forming)
MNSVKEGWTFIVADAQIGPAEKKVSPYINGRAIAVDIQQPEQRKNLIQETDIVISLLPPSLHIQVARDCIQFKKNLLTASYIDASLKALEKEIIDADILFLCEMGLDPGIDHMSAMELIHRLKNDGASIESFISHCGGLIAPESDNNPWHYKISWNPRNIVLAGAAGATYRMNGDTIHKPYAEIFKQCDSVDIPGLYGYAWYPNRDSLSYIPIYQLENVSTFIRTTLRHSAFCKGWQILVDLGLTDTADSDEIRPCKTYDEWIQTKLSAKDIHKDWNLFLSSLEADQIAQMKMLSLDRKASIPSGLSSSADILQSVIEERWILDPTDKDMIVMQHELRYKDSHHRAKNIRSTLIVKGNDQERTAMAKTVGLPLGIAAKLMLQGKIKGSGLKIPVEKEIYEPVLEELRANGIAFHESLF